MKKEEMETLANLISEKLWNKFIETCENKENPIINMIVKQSKKAEDEEIRKKIKMNLG